MLYLTKLLLTIFTGLALVLSVACSSNAPDNGAVAQHINKTPCTRGFIRPPGIRKCINLSDIVAGRVKDPSPKKACPKDWQRLQPKRYCLPKFSVIGCGNKTFACDSERSDVLRLIKGPPKCQQGTIVVSTDVPLFDQNGPLFLGTRPVLSCAGPSIGKPV